MEEDMKGKERGKFLLSLNIIDSLSLLINNRTQLSKLKFENQVQHMNL